MKPRRTHAEVVADRRAQNAREVAAPIAVLRAARRAERHDGSSPQDVARHLYYKAECSLYEIAQRLEHMGYRTPRGKLRWSAEQVRRELSRISVKDADDAMPLRRPRRAHMHRTPRFRSDESRSTQIQGDRLWPKAEQARDMWSVTTHALPPGQPRPPEPLLDSRGRVLKGRRFSKIKLKKA